MHIVRTHAGNVRRGKNARFGNDDALGSDFRQQAQGGVEADLESAQIAVVDALQRGFQLQGGIELFGVVRPTSTAGSGFSQAWPAKCPPGGPDKTCPAH